MKKSFYFCGQIIPEKIMEENFEELKSHISVAGNTFYNALLDGISGTDSEVYTSTLLPKKLCDLYDKKFDGKWKTFFEKRSEKFVFRIINNLTSSVKGIFKFNKAEKSSQKYVVFDVLRLGAAVGGILACNILRIKKIGIVTDVPGYRIKTTEKEGFFKKFCDKFAQVLLKSFDCYVLLSESMSEVIPLNGKPYTVIEGLYRISDYDKKEDIDKYNEFTIMYAGSLMYRYGIMNLVNAVRAIEDEDIRLLVFGDGEAKEEIIDISEEDNRICYKGSVSHGEILCEERKASLLVNPRPVEDEYVKYSFPSKNMEYMASGTPVLLTNIPSLPEEYKEYVYLASNGSEEELNKQIISIKRSDDKASVSKKSLLARKFILENKNQYVQAEKLVDFLNKCERINGK